MKFLVWMMIAAVIGTFQTAADAADSPTRETTVSPEGCRVEKYTIASASMKRDIRVLVVLPPEYDADAAKTYPVLYALHGRGAPYTVWSDMSLLRKALNTKPMIIASFDGDTAGWYIDSTKKPESQFDTFFFDEFMPQVETAYRASGVRGVTGFSMGGYGAMHYLVSRPELFASVSGLSSAVGRIITQDGKARRDILELLGPDAGDEANYRKYAVAPRLAALVAKGAHLPPIMQHCGSEDFLLNDNRQFVAFMAEQNKIISERIAKEVADVADQRARRKKLAKLMKANRIEYSYTESPGGHDWTFWLNASPGVATFHWNSFAAAKPVPLAAKAGR